MIFSRLKPRMPSPETALPGRTSPILASGARHFVNARLLHPPFPAHIETAVFGLGCFWGAERLFWQLGQGIWVTAVGYAGGFTPNPTYDEVCSGHTGHTEAVLVAFDPAITSFDVLLSTFWEAHDPTQGNRQGNDIGTQYRSAIYASTEQQLAASERSRERYAAAIAKRGFGGITTEVRAAPSFYYAEEYHQQYLAKNPGGYCGLAGTGVTCPAD
jgi:peptide-methionine (S)-S-oxide reductase